VKFVKKTKAVLIS